MRVIGAYVFREILAPFAIGLGVFTLILLIARILKLIEMVVNRGVSMVDVLRLLAYILPTFLEVTMPMAVLLAIVVGFGRLSSDSELVALKASGLSLYQLAIPVAKFSVVIWVLATLTSFYARPWGNAHLRNALYDIAKSRATAGIKQRVFTDEFEGLVIYVDEIEPPGELLKGILISDSRDPKLRSTIVAKVGSVLPNEDTHVLTLRLLDGTVHSFYQGDRSYHRTDFATFDITLDLAATLARLRPRELDPSEMNVTELLKTIHAHQASGESTIMERAELHRKFSIPFASLIFAVIGIPLGTRPSRSVRSRGFAVSIALVFIYYLLLTLGESFAQRGVLRPSIALWLPNIIFAPTALLLFARSATDSGARRWGFLAEHARATYARLPVRSKPRG